MNEATNPRLFPTLDSIESILWPGGALLVFFVTAVLVDTMILLAMRWRLLDLPNIRSAHSLPTARGGGTPMVLTCCLASLSVGFRWPSLAFGVVLGIVLPSLAIAVVGFLDDLKPLRASLRLLVQIAVAVAVVLVLGPLRSVSLPGFGPIGFGWLAWPLSIVWIVGLTNAFNFMDGSDGMAALGAFVVAAAMVFMGLVTGDLAMVLLAAFVGAAAGGFLVFNWSPARIFMGDVGSAFLGTFFAALALLASQQSREAVFIPMVMALWPYIYDPLLSVMRRAWNGHNPLVPHREFLFHRLIRSGTSHRHAAILYAVLSLMGGAAGLLMLDEGIPPASRCLLPLTTVLLAAGLTYGIERRCRQVGLDNATRRPAGVPG